MISVVIPAFNEGATVGIFVQELMQVLGNSVGEILVVDDGSHDGCCDTIASGCIRVIKHPVNRGYGASLKTGIRHAQGTYVVICDSDGQHRVEDVVTLIEKCTHHDMVVGARDRNSHAPLLRQPGKKILAAVVNYLAEEKIPDFNSGLRSFKKTFVLNILHLMPDGFSFSTTSTLAAFKMGRGVHYFPITVQKRTGISTVNQLRHGPETLLLIIRLITIFNPLKVFLPTSGMLLCAGIGMLVYESVLVFKRPHITASVLILLLASLLIFFFGIVTDQIAAIRREMSMQSMASQAKNDVDVHKEVS